MTMPSPAQELAVASTVVAFPEDPQFESEHASTEYTFTLLSPYARVEISFSGDNEDGPHIVLDDSTPTKVYVTEEAEVFLRRRAGELGNVYVRIEASEAA